MRTGVPVKPAASVRDEAPSPTLRTQLSNPDSATLSAFGELLGAHVRFEERQMFVALDALLQS